MVSQDFPPAVGGIQTYALELATRFARSSKAFLMVAPGAPEAAACDADLGFEVRRLGLGSSPMPALASVVLGHLAKRRGFDTVLYCQWQTGVASVLGWPRSPLERYFVSAHGNELLLAPAAGLPALQRGYDRLRARVLAGAQAVLCISHFTAGLAEGAGALPERVRVVPNGTDPERFRPLDASALSRELGLQGSRVVVSVGRLTERKGFDTMIRALPRVLAEVPEVVYVLAGDGDDRSRLEALAHDLGVAERVRLVGRVEPGRVVEYYNLGEVFVTPSRQVGHSVEGFGLVFLEANACAKPVIGARSGGVAEAILDGETGLVIPPDDPAALAGALCDLLRDPARCRRMGERGRARVLVEGTWDAVHARLRAEMER